MYDIDKLRREEFPHSATIAYLNHAAISPLPHRSKREAQRVIEELSTNPTRFFTDTFMPAVAALSESLARLINAASPIEIIATTSTSAALNAIAQAIQWEPGDNILFCDLEFPSNAYPWMSLARDGVESRCVPSVNGGLTLPVVAEYVDERTRVVAVSAIQFFSGHRADLASIGQFCREHGILFVVDAIQAIGHMPIDVQAMNIDILATGGQKSVLALPGTGFIYAREQIANATAPRLIHSNSTVNFLHWLAYDLTPLPGAARFGSGTPNVVGLMALATSVSLLTELGVGNIDRHTSSLARYSAGALSSAGVEVITPLDAIGPIVTFRSPYDEERTDSLIQFLAERNVVAGKHLDPESRPYIRLSYHCYNVAADFDRFVEEFHAFAR